MKFIKLIFAFTLAHAICSCGAKDASANEAERVEKEIATGNSAINPLDYSDLIKTVYSNFVFAIDATSEVYAHPERYFSANALKKLKDSYDFDCEDNNCYAFYELRTQEQDSKPGTTGNLKSSILRISEMIGMSLNTLIWVGPNDTNKDCRWKNR